MHTLISIAYGLIALGILVLVHELGHFLVARLFKVRVDEFAIMFGKPIFQYKKGDTVYKIGFIPLGGYCKMAGEDPRDTLTGAPDEFYSKPPAQRLAIIFAGSGVNYLFGILIFIIIMAVGQTQVTFSNRISVLDTIKLNKKEISSPAKKAGIRSGDEITEINQIPVNTWSEIQKKIAVSGDKEFNTLKIKRGNSLFPIRIKSLVDPDTGSSLIGIIPFVDNKVKNLSKDGPALLAGMKPGDRIVRIDRKEINEFNDLKNYLSVRPGRYVDIQVKRDNTFLSFHLKTQNVEGKGYIGAEFSLEEKTSLYKSKNVLYAFSDGFKRANNVIVEIIYGLKLMISGQVKVAKAVSGPVMIVYFVGETAHKSGLANFLVFLAYISIALAFFNLLPIPAVDGSYILIFLVEMVINRKLNYKAISIVQYVGLMALFGLLILVSFNDVNRLLHGLGQIKNTSDYLKAIMS